MRGPVVGWGLALGLALAACGSSSKTKTTTAACEPVSCASAGKTCGTMGDGCGHVLDCGTCPAGQSCGGGGTANVCGAVAGCTPTTCAAQHATCGSIPDGCGGTLSCGPCPPGESCGAGGTPNVCVTNACTPTTCAAQKTDCGGIPDGCGGTLDCGACKAGEQCGAGGTPNVCAAPPPQPEVKWVSVVSTPGPDLVAGAGVDGKGNRLVLTVTVDERGTSNTLRLQKLGADGSAVWKSEWQFSGFSAWTAFHLAVAGTGDVYLAAAGGCGAATCPGTSVDLGGGAIGGSALVKLGPDGKFAWQVPFPDEDPVAAAADPTGRVALLTLPHAGAQHALHLLDGTGREAYRVDTDGGVAVGIDPSGDAVVPFGTWGQPGVVEKHGPDGTVVWSKPLPGGGWVYGTGTSAKGTVVVLADRTGDVTFGGSTVNSGALVLYVFEADGSPRWATGFEWLGGASLAVDPTGRVAVAGTTGTCGELAVWNYDLAGASLWRRGLPSDGKCWQLTMGALAYGADHEPLACGMFYGPVDLGGTTYTPQGEDAFAADFSP